MAKAGRLSAIAAQGAREAIEAQRAELMFRATRDERKATDEILRIIPQGAELYRAAVRNLNSTLKTQPSAARLAR